MILDRSLSDLQEISVTAWIKWSGGTSNQPVWFFGAATNKCMFLTPDDGTGHAKFVIRTNSSDQTLVAPAALVTGVWTHVAVTLSNGATGRLYMNGVLQQQGNISIMPDQLTAPDGNTNLPQNYLARGADSSKPFFNGAVDSFRVYTGALTNGEITAMQSANLAPTLNPVPNQTTKRRRRALHHQHGKRSRPALADAHVQSADSAPGRDHQHELGRDHVAAHGRASQHDKSIPGESSGQRHTEPERHAELPCHDQAPGGSKPERRGDLERTIHGADQSRLWGPTM